MYITITNEMNCSTTEQVRDYLEAVNIPFKAVNPLMYAIEEIVNDKEDRDIIYRDLKEKCNIELYNDNDELIETL